MRFINRIYTAQIGKPTTNEQIAEVCRHAIGNLEVTDQRREELMAAVDYFLVGQRTRNAVQDWHNLGDFSHRAATFEKSANEVIGALAEQIRTDVREAGVTFDAILTTTSTGSLMPGLSYRAARALENCVRPDSMMLDLAHVGCTGAIKLLDLVHQLQPDLRNCLLLSVEVPTTLVNLNANETDVWQGNCTFGDGAAALWVSGTRDHTNMALAIEDLVSTQYAPTHLDLIQWGYSSYYTFRVAEEKTFNREVRKLIAAALQDVDASYLQSPYWAMHPAGLALMLRLSRKLGMERAALQPTIDHYNQFSNMSSAGIVHILRDVAQHAEQGADINLLTMGAGFNVIYGRLRKESP